MAGQKREARLHPDSPGHPRLKMSRSLKDVDARDKPGHDESEFRYGYNAGRAAGMPYSAGLAEPVDGFGPVIVAVAFFSTMRTA
jgi:hypothetical protein